MYMDPWNANSVRNSTDNSADRRPGSDTGSQSAPPKAKRQPHLIRFDIDRFNKAVETFFENARPPLVNRGNLPVPMVLVGYDYSAGGYLMAKYANPLTRKIEAWGLDVKDFRENRLTPRCFHT